MESELFGVSSFSLAKGKELVSEDFAAVKVVDELCIGIVCDGVGSAEAGKDASRRVVNYLMKNFKNRPKSWSIEKSLKHFISGINSILYREGIDEYSRPEYATTLSIVVIEGNRLYGANVGDSPIYLFRDGELTELSVSHVESEPGMEHVLTQAIGIEESVEPYIFENNLIKGDTILLASDGLEKVMSLNEVKSKLNLDAFSLVKAASRKVDDLLPDDTSAVVIKVLGQSKREKLKKIDIPIPQSIKVGEIIDGYKLLKPLVQNERTWLAENKGKQYVLKFPPVEAAEDEKLLDLFIKEAWNASRLKAGFFPKAVIPKHRSARYYVMEYLDGISLKELILKKPINIEDAINLTKFLLNASGYLLKYDLVHGDIKPENIMVLQRHGKRVFKLVDFGSIVEIFSIASRAGTPSYLAPERFMGEPISEQTEIFAIGVTLYEALTGKFPYGEIEPFQTPTFKEPKGLRHFNKAVPAWLESIVMRAVERNKDRRYEVYSEMEYELTHPEKVKPYYPEGLTIFEREPVKIYRVLFIISLLFNMFFIALLLR